RFATGRSRRWGLLRRLHWPDSRRRLDSRFGRLRLLVTAMFHTAHKHAFCITCGFCLFGQTHRCPECGRPFDPDDLFSYAPPPDRRRDWRVYGMAAVVVVGAAAIAAAIVAVMPS
ncbi:MAG: hypothetical protein V3S19_06920, partial [Gemmatimonadales bacterium]